MSCLTERFFLVVNTHTHHIVFEGDNSSKGLPAIFNIEVWKENAVTCWEKCPDIPTDCSQRILVCICFSQNWDHSKTGGFYTPHSKKLCSLTCAWTSFLSCGLSNRHKGSCKPGAWVGVGEPLAGEEGSSEGRWTSQCRGAEGQPP